MQCDVIAVGVIEAMRAMKLNVPLVVRLNGTNKEAGIRLLEESGSTLSRHIRWWMP